ncbi:MAG: CFI-box-CTERM domain-containing protein, partial [Methermicoccaceae archaeon]
KKINGKATELLNRSLGDINPDIRKAAAEALKWMGEEESSAEPLLKAQNDTNPDVRMAVSNAFKGVRVIVLSDIDLFVFVAEIKKDFYSSTKKWGETYYSLKSKSKLSIKTHKFTQLNDYLSFLQSFMSKLAAQLQGLEDNINNMDRILLSNPNRVGISDRNAASLLSSENAALTNEIIKGGVELVETAPFTGFEGTHSGLIEAYESAIDQIFSFYSKLPDVNSDPETLGEVLIVHPDKTLEFKLKLEMDAQKAQSMLQKFNAESKRWSSIHEGSEQTIPSRFGEYPPDWADIRKRILHRDGYRCRKCGRTNTELHVHHIMPLSKGGSSDPSNLITLCRDCHENIHPHLKAAREAREAKAKGRCFIATAAYGTPYAEEVVYLRAWRDQSLSKSRAGRTLIESYYLISPSIAKIVEKSELFRRVIRAGLRPLIRYVKRKNLRGEGL